MRVPLPSKPVCDLATKIQLQLLVIHRTLDLGRYWRTRTRYRAFFSVFSQRRTNYTRQLPRVVSRRFDANAWWFLFDYFGLSPAQLLEQPSPFYSSSMPFRTFLPTRRLSALDKYSPTTRALPLGPSQSFLSIRFSEFLYAVSRSWCLGKKSLLEGRSEGGSWW